MEYSIVINRTSPFPSDLCMQCLPIFSKKDTRLIWVKDTVPGHAVVQYCTFSISERSIFQIIFGSFPVHSAVSYSYCSHSIKLAQLDLAS